jgi:hypothetical protein
MKRLEYGVKLKDGSEIKSNAVDYAGGLILYTETHPDMEALLFLFAEFCKFAKMKANAEMCVLISKVRPHSLSGKAERDRTMGFIHTDFGDDEIQMEIFSAYLGMPIWFNDGLSRIPSMNWKCWHT